MGLSLKTPPLGICLYVACGLSDLKIEDILRPMIPFLPRLLGYVH